MINGIYLLLGSNLGDRKWHLEQAKLSLTGQQVDITGQSSLYLTPPWGYTSQPHFLNQALRVSTSLTPELLMATCLHTENIFGRVRKTKYAARTIDIDILYYNDLVMATELLTLPHPRLHVRRFVLAPMSELSPDFLHPVLNKTQSELLRDCPDTLPVRKLANY